jgi:hypothetical protein
MDPPSHPAPGVVTVPKNTKRPRHRKGEAKAKPGKLSWVHSTKKTFFACRKEDWLREADTNRAGEFYKKMAKLYVKKYGMHLADDQDLEFDIEDPPDSTAEEVVHEVSSEEEQAFRTAYMKTLCTVSEV